jgi:5-methylcytosine-specific restriction endonuclease McrA
MSTIWDDIFDKHGLKTVTKTDKNKSAYVLNKAQLAAVHAAGIEPSDERPAKPFEITLFLEKDKTVQATFYNSIRDGADRDPEPRIGREFISSWLEKGDMVVIGNIGEQLYTAKVEGDFSSALNPAESVAKRATEQTQQRLIERAKKVTGKPARKVVSRNDFTRSPVVVMGAIARANGSCEMPECTALLFDKDDDSPYLEVHHIVTLAEGGDDTLLNAAALCPRCHRELHFGKKRLVLRTLLMKHITSKN